MDGKSIRDEARRLLSNGLPTAASDILEEYLATNAGEPELLHLLGRIRMLQGRPSDAVTLLKQALRLHRHTPCPTFPAPMALDGSSALLREQAACIDGPDTTGEDDWDLIETTAVAQQGRRRFFDSEVDAFDQHQRCEPSPGRQSEHRSTQNGPQEPPQAQAAIFPPGQSIQRVQQAANRIVGPHEQRTPEARNVSVREELEIHLLDASDQDAQTEFDFELPDDNAADEAQIRFEESLELGLGGEDWAKEAAEDGEADDLDLVVDSETDQEASNLDWEEFAFDADDFNEAPTREDFREVASAGRLTRLERARQHAIRLGVEFGWEEDGVALLTEVFERYWWSKAKESMLRELEAGMRPEELKLALALREIWAAHPEFAMDFSGLQGNTLAQTTRAVYRNLSWPMALALVRSTDGYPDVDWLEHLLWELFDDWYTGPLLRRRMKSFNLYLFFRLGIPDHQFREWLPWTFEPDEALGLELDDDYQPGFSTPEYQALNSLGVIPHVFVTPREREKAIAQIDEEAPAIPELGSEEGGERDEGARAPGPRVAFKGNRITTLAGGTNNSGASPSVRRHSADTWGKAEPGHHLEGPR